MILYLPVPQISCESDATRRAYLLTFYDRTMSFDMVTLRIGDPGVAVDLPVYQDVLSAVSHYFRGAFDSSFKEATERFTPLTDVTEQTFRIFLQ